MKAYSEIEALLFVAGNEGLSARELASILNKHTSVIYNHLDELKAYYLESKERALTLLEVGDRYILSTKKEFAPLLKTYAQSSINQSLSQAALECLSIVAYKQPITRIEIDHLRGVQSSGSVQKLIARQLIEEKSRVDGPGRAILYGTTTYFLDYFGLKTIDELPTIEQLEENSDTEIPNDLFFNQFKETFNEAKEEHTHIDEKDVVD